MDKWRKIGEKSQKWKKRSDFEEQKQNWLNSKNGKNKMINKKWRKIGKMNKIERYGQTGQNGEKNTRFKVGLKIKYWKIEQKLQNWQSWTKLDKIEKKNHTQKWKSGLFDRE